MKKVLTGIICILLCVQLSNVVFAQTVGEPAKQMTEEETAVDEKKPVEKEAEGAKAVHENEGEMVAQKSESPSEPPNEQAQPAVQNERAGAVVNQLGDFLIPDNCLREKINQSLGKNKDYSATKEELATIKALNISSYKETLDIQSFQGIEYLTNLSSLTIISAAVPADVSEHLGKLTSLTYLLLNTVYVTGQDAVIKDEYGKEIGITQTVNFSPLGNLKALQTLSLTVINTYIDQNYMAYNRVKSELSGLGKLTNLTKLYLGQFGDTDDNSMAWLAGCVNLEEVVITDSSMNSVQGLGGLTKLKNINVNGNKIRDFSPIAANFNFRGANSNSFLLPTQFLRTEGEQSLLDLNGLVNVGNSFGSAAIKKFSSFDNFDVQACRMEGGLVNATLSIKNLQEIQIYNWRTGKKDLKTLGTMVPYWLNINDGKVLEGHAIVPIGKIVTYKDNYPGGQSKEVKHEPLEDIQNITPGERKGYTFVGWHEDSAGEKAFDFQKRIDTNLTLYAKWRESQAVIYAKDSTIYVGDKWGPADNFVSARDQHEQEIKSFDPEKIQVSGQVDVYKVGKYPVTYSIDGAETTINVTVRADRSAIQAKDSVLKVGDKWAAKDNFVSWTDRDGKKQTFFDPEKIQVEGTVDTSKVGRYPVMYKVNGVQTIANITVIAEKDDKVPPVPVKPDKGSADQLDFVHVYTHEQAKLPQTGEQRSNWPWGMAGCLLLLTGLIILVKNRKI
ncbi:bacterial Ig-like domain-containing protein [Listeria costaricensis]|uniref:bacterial Ig-like domain-containing protein n=1 Tax=Listeria costaricensis TaxID=2026604 RepID=UPI000C085C99|nr:bacterial Ig-like domain-containing protein [Listeria costaricensis]